jgi:methyl-accepting chemotaxis protein
MNLTEIVQTSGWRSFMAKLYGFGASVVIVGALFKIQHWPMAGTFLTIGLLTEAIIFFFSAFEPRHEEVDWTLVYPELAGLSDEDDLDSYKRPIGGSTSALEKFDNLIENAEISPDLFRKLGNGLNKLTETAEKMNDISDASFATNNYVDSVQKAASTINSHTENYVESSENLKHSVDKLSDSYEKTANLITESGSSYQNLSESFSHIEDGSKSYGSHLEVLNKNLSALNAAYELQLQGTNEHLQNTEALYEGLQNMMEDLQSSANNTKRYKEEVTKLSDNLSALNTIYGNMLAAMNVMNK